MWILFWPYRRFASVTSHAQRYGNAPRKLARRLPTGHGKIPYSGGSPNAACVPGIFSSPHRMISWTRGASRLPLSVS